MPPASDHVSDAELLRRFIASNDSAAFELVVRRHADTVWVAVSRILRNDANAEDAFQATFLVLIRKAKSIRLPCVGGWLHRVAVNAALKLRERSARVSPLEPAQLDALAVSPTESPDTELAAAVHEELTRLPERERLPIVLCDLEGLSHADAAKSLGWPVGTVSGRLSRARAKLRARLERRGLTPSIALLPAAFTPPHLISQTLSLTTSTAPPVVVTLAEGVLSAMRTAKWKLTAVIFAATGFVAVAGFGTVFALAPKPAALPAAQTTTPGEGGEEPQAEPNEKPKIDPKWRHQPFPSAFPEISPLTAESLKEFTTKHVEPIYESDPPLRKLQKAKLRIALAKLESAVANAEAITKPPGKERPPGFYGQVYSQFEALEMQAKNTVALAIDLYPSGEARRQWLVLRVAAEKRIEQDFMNFMKAHSFGRLDNDLPRIEAEIELAKHDKRQ